MVIREMIFGSRKLCLAIMLGLLLGHASAALHAAAHASVDVSDCGICFSYGHLSKAISVPPDGALPPSRPALDATLVRTSQGLQAPVPTHQRGPPAWN
jgi:hypothetical protein